MNDQTLLLETAQCLSDCANRMAKLADRFLEEANKIDGTKLFHGGCHGCEMRESFGVVYCKLCQYMDCDWTKPDFNTSHYSYKNAVEMMNDILDAL
jgi:hypothetical protein